MGDLVGLCVALALYNNVANTLARPVHHRHYVALNLAFLAAVLAWALLGPALTPGELGLGWPAGAWSALVGLGLGLLLALPLGFMALLPGLVRRVSIDPRVVGLTGREVVGRALVRIPIGTALFEEMLFRGVLFGLAARLGVGHAFWVSSLVFALWHLAPASVLLRTGVVGRSRLLIWGAFMGGIAGTFVADCFSPPPPLHR